MYHLSIKRSLIIKLTTLRRIALFHQGLTKMNPFGKGIPAVKRALEHLGYIQIDTISVVERAHHHILWTRIPEYNPDHIYRLIKERHAFEYWFHAASYLPMRDYRFALPRMSSIKRGESSWFSKVDAKSMDYVYDRIRIDGPLKARDFESAINKSNGWWDWKPTKLALEKLFMQGDLMIANRDGMEKVYDLTERVLPNGINTTLPTLMEFAEHLVNSSLNANGFTTIKQIAYLRRGSKLRNAIQIILQQKIEEGSVTEHSLEGMPVVYAAGNIFDRSIKEPSSNVRLLSPFDNAVIHRDRTQLLFGFDYRLECYTPKENRQFGYFCLPILYKDKLIGRADCKTHRKTGLFEIIHLHIEDKNIDIDHFIPLFTKSVHRFSEFNNCHSIKLSKVSPNKLTNIFRSGFRNLE